MEKCPVEETLERFINLELTEEMNQNIFAHLSVCDNCREKVGCRLSEEHELLKSLLSDRDNRKMAKTANLGRCLPNALILAYAGQCLNEDQLKLVESHLQRCDKCLLELLKVQRSMNFPVDLNLDMQTLMAIPGPGTSVLEIVLKIKESFIELIRHTGELLTSSTPLAAVRGIEQKGERPIVIRKDFADRDLSLEMTIKKEVVNSVGHLIMSVMKLSNEEFLSGANVVLSGKKIDQTGRTDESGIVEFLGIEPGTYEIKVDGVFTASIVLE